MSILRWLPVILVVPTFAFIGYWMWRYMKSSETGRLPRTIAEMKQVDDRFREDFATAGRRLRWFNLWLMLAVVVGFVVTSLLMRK
jgi:hypothetical protein